MAQQTVEARSKPYLIVRQALTGITATRDGPLGLCLTPRSVIEQVVSQM
jgi:hypothetical protein